MIIKTNSTHQSVRGRLRARGVWFTSDIIPFDRHFRKHIEINIENIWASRFMLYNIQLEAFRCAQERLIAIYMLVLVFRYMFYLTPCWYGKGSLAYISFSQRAGSTIDFWYQSIVIDPSCLHILSFHMFGKVTCTYPTENSEAFQLFNAVLSNLIYTGSDKDNHIFFPYTADWVACW